jgi:threo-3-hydroxy-L-aspartate ammonia-lyase
MFGLLCWLLRNVVWESSTSESPNEPAHRHSVCQNSMLQALAYAAQIMRLPATIIIPKDVPELKVRATKGYGAEVISYDRYTENREEIGRRIAAERGASIIPPYDHPDVIAGQGTATLELIEEAGPLDALYVCLGSGGLLAGAAVKGLR